MGTSSAGFLSREEAACLPEARQAMQEVGKLGESTQFNFFAAFDGTNNDKDSLKLSGTPYPTNVANLFNQADGRRSEGFESGYYKGVGTGGDQGNITNAAFNPTPAINAAAEKAYGEFVEASTRYLNTHPEATLSDISASTVGFSRGCASAVRFAQLVNDRGLVAPDGTEVAPPGSIKVTGMALIDPVATGVKGNMGIPPNVKGQVLVVQGMDENRSHFRPLYYGDDPRVTTVPHPGNHVGVGGGYDLNGTAANVLEGVTGYFQERGMPLADVPLDQRYDPTQLPQRYTEVYATARNGDRVPSLDGSDQLAWPQDNPSLGRVEVRPQMSEQQKAWLQKAVEEAGPGLQAQGLSAEQCKQVCLACVSSAEHNKNWGAPERFLLGKDGSSVAVVHKEGRFAEVDVDKAIQTGVGGHVDRLHQQAQEPVQLRQGTMAHAPAPQIAEPQWSR